MKLQIENFEVECFETEQDLIFFLDVHKNDIFMQKLIYKGNLYKVPNEIENQFNVDLIYQIKKRNFTDVQSIMIFKQ